MTKNNARSILKKLSHLYSLHIERHLYLNWFNPFVTLYFNLRLLSFKDAIKLPIFVYGWPRILSLYGKAEVGGVKYGGVKLNRSKHEAGAPNNMGCAGEFNIWGTVVFKGACSIGTAGKITIGMDAVLEFGDNCKIMSHCNIASYKAVTIGDNFLMAHASQIYDTSFHYVADFNRNIVGHIGRPVIIGNNCWMCNASTIMGGVSIPSYTIIASHSLVNKINADMPEECIIAGIPAKIVATNFRKIDNPEMLRKISSYFSENPSVAEYHFKKGVNHNQFS